MRQVNFVKKRSLFNSYDGWCHIAKCVRGGNNFPDRKPVSNSGIMLTLETAED